MCEVARETTQCAMTEPAPGGALMQRAMLLRLLAARLTSIQSFSEVLYLSVQIKQIGENCQPQKRK
jgi:hypothetical protein